MFVGTNVIWQSARPVTEASQDVGCETRLKDARKAMFEAVDRANMTIGLNDIDEYFARQLDFGRAVAFPVYKGTFERRVGNVLQRAAFNAAEGGIAVIV